MPPLVAGTERLDAQAVECPPQINEAPFGVYHPAGAPAAPENPAEPFEGGLAPEIRRPSVGAMPLITVELDCEAAVVGTFDDEVDAEASYGHLSAEPVSHLDEPRPKILLKLGIADIEDVLPRRDLPVT
jgi:hypothetical protein